MAGRIRELAYGKNVTDRTGRYMAIFRRKMKNPGKIARASVAT